MVKVGFICEGQTEALLLSSQKFDTVLKNIGIEIINVLDAEGAGNLRNNHINAYTQILERQGAEKIIILTDLDDDTCITITKQRVNSRAQDIVVIAVRQIEAWFLASTETMRKLLKLDTFEFTLPEKELQPFETINQLLFTNTGRGIGKKSSSKVKLVRSLLTAGLDITEAASHPNCPSAGYFINKLNAASQQTGVTP